MSIIFWSLRTNCPRAITLCTAPSLYGSLQINFYSPVYPISRTESGKSNCNPDFFQSRFVSQSNIQKWPWETNYIFGLTSWRTLIFDYLASALVNSSFVAFIKTYSISGSKTPWHCFTQLLAFLTQSSVFFFNRPKHQRQAIVLDNHSTERRRERQYRYMYWIRSQFNARHPLSVLSVSACSFCTDFCIQADPSIQNIDSLVDALAASFMFLLKVQK